MIRDHKISLPRLNSLHPAVREEAILTIEQAELGLPTWVAVRVVQALRSIAYQNALYAQGRTKPGPIVTKAKGGSSYHNYGLALDFAFVVDKDKNGSFETLSWSTVADLDKDLKADWLEVVDLFICKGWKWGHAFADDPHLDKTFDINWREYYKRYINKDFIKDTEYVRIV